MREIDKILGELVSYVKENVWNYEARLQVALDVMDHMRVPLQMADGCLSDEIFDAMNDFWEDHFSVHYDDITIEDVIFY